MKKFKVEITETLQKVVEVEAGDIDEALGIAVDRWNSGDIVLTADDFIDGEFSEFRSEV